VGSAASTNNRIGELNRSVFRRSEVEIFAISFVHSNVILPRRAGSRDTRPMKCTQEQLNFYVMELLSKYEPSAEELGIAMANAIHMEAFTAGRFYEQREARKTAKAGQ
jgi:hypothetical protein